MTMTATKTLPCVQLPCPRCAEPSANISLQMWTLEDQDGENFVCAECNETFSLNTIRELVRCWGPMVAWLEQIPTPPETE
jgi:hypothetical protein